MFLKEESITKDHADYTWPVLICHCIFLILLAYSWIFYKERIIPFDGSFYMFKIIHLNDFSIENDRTGAVVNQWLPLLGLKYGLSLESIMRLYSLSFMLFNYFLFIISVHFLKNKIAGLAMCIALTAGYRYSFYYAPSEVHLAVAPSVLLFAVVSSPILQGQSIIKNIIKIILACIVIWFISISHELFIVTIFFILIYQLIEEKYKSIPLYIILSFTAGWFLYLIKSIPEGSYRGGKIPDAAVFLETIPTIFHLPSTKYFLRVFPDIFLPCIILIILTISFVYLKDKIKATWVLMSMLGFAIINFVGHRFGESEIVLQNYYVVFGVIIGIPAAESFLKSKHWKRWTLLILILITIDLAGIYKASKLYTKRLEYIEAISEYSRRYPERKFLISEEDSHRDLLSVEWDISFESLLYNCLKHPDSALSFNTIRDITEYDSLLADTNLFIGVDFAPLWFSSNSMNRKYFNLKNTTYRKLDSKEDKLFLESQIK